MVGVEIAKLVAGTTNLDDVHAVAHLPGCSTRHSEDPNMNITPAAHGSLRLSRS